MRLSVALASLQVVRWKLASTVELAAGVQTVLSAVTYQGDDAVVVVASAPPKVAYQTFYVFILVLPQSCASLCTVVVVGAVALAPALT